MRVILRFLLGLVFLLGPMLAIAKDYSKAETERLGKEIMTKKNQQNFRGWKGIAFYCDVDDKSNNALIAICDKAHVNAAFLAAAAKIDLIKLGNYYELGLHSITGDSLILFADIVATKKSKSPVGISVILKAYTGYSKAQDAPLYSKSGKKMARSGELILWERTAIGASTDAAADLVAPMSQGIEELLKVFFTDYMKAQE